MENEHRVTPLELFFDLVFVFALTQVTALVSDDPTWAGLGRGLLVLTALWWAWGAYAWLTNTIEIDEGKARLALFGAMAAMLLAALSVPEAFGAHGVLFGAAYFVVRFLHIVLYAAGTPDLGIRMAVRRLSRTAIPAPALLVVAGFLDGADRIALWLAALAIDYAGPYVFGIRGLTVSPAHFAERFGLVVIVALGESIVAIGIGAAGADLDLGLVAAAVVGVAVAATLWWAYFDVVAIAARARLAEARGYVRLRIARDAYSYLHLPLIAGILLVALGIKKTLEHVEQPLDTVPAVALCGGFALFLLAHSAFKLRTLGTVGRQRLIAAAACVALIPLAREADALVALAAVAAVGALLVAYETLGFRDTRARIRTAV